MGTPQTLAAQLAEERADMVAAITAAQRATALAYNYRAEAAAQDSLQEQVRFMNASIQQAHMARGYAKHADEAAARVKELTAQLQDAHLAERDTLTLMGRLTLTAEQTAGMDDMGGIAA